MSGHPELTSHLRSCIQQEGPLSFADYMRDCLYHPDYGYYVTGGDHVGRYGDFYTSVSVSYIFGQLLGQQFEEMWRILGEPETFVIIEQGANTGQFAVDVLGWLSQWRPELYQRCAYWFVEPHPPLKAAQEKKIREYGYEAHAYWVDSVDQLEGAAATGIFFSNELIDSFPTHIVRFDNGVWKEKQVGLNMGTGKEEFQFEEIEIPAGPLLTEIERWSVPRIQNYTTEASLEAGAWMRTVGSALDRGFVVTVDYGYPADLLYYYNRMEGTLTCYREHKKSYNPLVYAGLQDITAHINFDLLAEEGAQVGLRQEGLVDQHHFMVGVARDDYLAFQEQQLRQNPDDPQIQGALRAFRSLMHPEMMGTTFKFLIQSKGIEDVPQLMGLHYDKK
ncbi:MAG: SAM-dependent methyltransferase [Verrucomicrobiota bacterium]